MVHDLNLNSSDLKGIFKETYALDEAIVDRLRFFYSTKIGNKGNTKDVKIEDDDLIATLKVRTHNDNNLPSELLTLDDINGKVRNNVEDEFEVAVTCYTEYMLTAMHHVGTAIRKSYYWIKMSQTIYLVMNNSGGHGTSITIISYTKTLEVEFNIEIIYQKYPTHPTPTFLTLECG